jgi:hypothetical protein
MSISAKVVRSLIITSPEYLANILKNKEEILVLNEDLKTYVWIWEKYQQGCRCDDDVNLKEVNEQYLKISSDLEISEILCQEFKCVDVKFYGI